MSTTDLATVSPDLAAPFVPFVPLKYYKGFYDRAVDCTQWSWKPAPSELRGAAKDCIRASYLAAKKLVDEGTKDVRIWHGYVEADNVPGFKFDHAWISVGHTCYDLTLDAKITRACGVPFEVSVMEESIEADDDGQCWFLHSYGGPIGHVFYPKDSSGHPDETYWTQSHGI